MYICKPPDDIFEDQNMNWDKNKRVRILDILILVYNQMLSTAPNYIFNIQRCYQHITFRYKTFVK